MTQLTCPGLPADWINGWLAAVGATVLDTRLRLHWTTDGAPLAVLSAAEIDPVDALCESWPDRAQLSDMPIAEKWKGAGELRRKVPVEAFVTRARAVRGHPCSWTLSSTMTDLSVDENGEVAHAPFDRVRLFFVGGPTSLCGGGEAGGSWIRQRVVVVRKRRRGQAGDPTVLVPSATAGGFRWYSRASWKVSVRIKAPAARGGLRTASRGRHADRPFDEPATSAARRIAAATWMMSSTTVASRAYAAVPARRSRCSRGASRTSSAPAAGSARRRADAGRGGARSPDAQPASCRRSFPCDFRARTAPSTRHRWRPRPDRQSLPGCVGRDVLAGACVPTAGPAGAVPVRVRSRSSAGLRWRRGRLWHPRRQHRPPRPGDRYGGRRFAALARRLYVLGILSPQPSQVPLPKAPYQNAARMSRRERT